MRASQWTQPPLGPERPRYTIVHGGLAAAPPDLPPTHREDRCEPWRRLSIGRDPDAVRLPGDEVPPRLDPLWQPDDPTRALAALAAVLVEHRALEGWLLYHYAGTYEKWRFDRLTVAHHDRAVALQPGEVAFLRPRRWYELRFGVLMGFTPAEVTVAHLARFAHTHLWLWLDHPEMDDAAVSGGGDTWWDPPAQELEASVIRSDEEAAVIAHNYGPMLLGRATGPLGASALAKQLAQSDPLDAGWAPDATEVDNILKRVWARISRVAPGRLNFSAKEAEAGVWLLRMGVVHLVTRPGVVEVATRDRASRFELAT